MLTVIIPAGGPGEIFFKRTIQDVLEKSAGDLEVYAMCDGWHEDDPVQDDRVTYLDLPYSTSNQKRQAVNLAISRCSGDLVMVLDAHCLMSEGFDVVFAEHSRPNRIMIPRRMRLDPFNWCLEPAYGRPPIDYEYFQWREVIKGKDNHDLGGLRGYKWDSRTLERLDLMVDDVFTCQASCWCAPRQWVIENDLFSVEGYGGWGAEAEQVVLGTLLAGGEAKVIKYVEEGHWHKGQNGRGYHLNRSERLASYAYSYDYWVFKQKEFFIETMDRFMPINNWPSNWTEILYQ